MAVAEELSRIGFEVRGTPPTTKVMVGHDEIAVKVTEVAEVRDCLHLRAELSVAALPVVPDLSGATISASGDTTLALAGSTLIGTRRLVAPSPGLLYDAIYELAKTIAAAAGLLSDLAEFEAAAPAPSEPAPLAVEVEYPVTAQSQAPAPPPPPTAAGPAPAAPAPVPVVGGFVPSHTVPAEGLPAWNSPDSSQPVAATLDAGLAVRLTGQQGGWAHVTCENTWTAWVDAAKLIPR